jgi:hypothetical protein
LKFEVGFIGVGDEVEVEVEVWVEIFESFDRRSTLFHFQTVIFIDFPQNLQEKWLPHPFKDFLLSGHSLENNISDASPYHFQGKPPDPNVAKNQRFISQITRFI